MTNFSHFTQLGNSFSRFTIKKHEQKRVQCLVKHLKRNFILDVWQGSEHASEEHLLRLVFLVNSAHLLRHRKLERKYWENSLPFFLTLSFVSSFVLPSEYVSWILLLMSRSFYLLDLRWMYSVFVTFPVTFYLFKDNNKINRKRLEIYSKLTKTCSHLFLLFQLLTFSREMFFRLRYTKKWIFPLRFSLVHVTKSTVSSGFGHIYWRSP